MKLRAAVSFPQLIKSLATTKPILKLDLTTSLPDVLIRPNYMYEAKPGKSETIESQL